MPEININHKTKNMENLFIKNNKSAETIKREVEQIIARQEHVVSGKEEAERFFAMYGDTRYVYAAEDRKYSVEGEVKGGWQTTYTVVIIAYFTEAGSDDDVYSVRVTED